MGFRPVYNLLNPSAGQEVPPGFGALDYRRITIRRRPRKWAPLSFAFWRRRATSDPSPGGGKSAEPLSPGSDYPMDIERAAKVKTRSASMEGV